jgi:hypothetical protein
VPKDLAAAPPATIRYTADEEARVLRIAMSSFRRDLDTPRILAVSVGDAKGAWMIAGPLIPGLWYS